MVYIIHHSADFDGAFSAVITANGLGYENKGTERDKLFEFIPYNYQNELLVPFDNVKLSEVLKPEDMVIFVDCSYTKDEDELRKMIDIVGPEMFILIDHHNTSINFFREKFPEIDMKGCEDSSTADDPKSAALLCHKYFNGACKIPMSLELVSKYDSWNKNDGNWMERTLPFQYGLRSKNLDLRNIPNSYDEIMKYLKDDSLASEILETGKIIVQHLMSESKGIIKSYSREAKLYVEWENSVTYYKVLIAPGHLRNSTLFEFGLDKEKYDEYDLFILERPNPFTGVNNISIISNRDDINAGRICQQFGGGGHFAIGSCNVKYKIIGQGDESLTMFKMETAE